MTTTKKLLEKIAKDHFHIETLEMRGSDYLDFQEVAVWNLEAALEAAYEAGMQAGRNGE